jgi:hypothetical protein
MTKRPLLKSAEPRPRLGWPLPGPFLQQPGKQVEAANE